MLEKLAFLRAHLGVTAVRMSFSISGMPDGTAERSRRLFADEVLPVLRTWT